MKLQEKKITFLSHYVIQNVFKCVIKLRHGQFKIHIKLGIILKITKLKYV